MKLHFLHLVQILLGLLLSDLVAGMVLASALPLWLARYVSLVAVLLFALLLVACFIIGLLLGGMELQRREHDKQMQWLVARATRKVRGIAA